MKNLKLRTKIFQMTGFFYLFSVFYFWQSFFVPSDLKYKFSKSIINTTETSQQST